MSNFWKTTDINGLGGGEQQLLESVAQKVDSIENVKTMSSGAEQPRQPHNEEAPLELSTSIAVAAAPAEKKKWRAHLDTRDTSDSWSMFLSLVFSFQFHYFIRNPCKCCGPQMKAILIFSVWKISFHDFHHPSHRVTRATK